VLFLVFVSRVLGGGAAEIGWLMSAQAIGGLIGGVLVGRFGKLVRPAQLIGVGGVLFGLLDLAIFNYPAFFPGFLPAVVLFIAVGVPGVVMFTGINTLLQSAVADEYRGRMFGAFGTTGALMALAGSALAGALGDHVPVVPVLSIQGGVYIIAGLCILVLLQDQQLASPEQQNVMADTLEANL
jgi:MFS family permease